MDDHLKPLVAIVGGGPAGLFAAEILLEAGLRVHIFDQMPTAARKFLMAGRGGLNITHSEDRGHFLSRYAAGGGWLAPMLDAFPPSRLQDWSEGLGEPTLVGSSGRVFPRSMKASPLLRAWLRRLDQLGAVFHSRHRWNGWDAHDRLIFSTETGITRLVDPAASLLALGGASWPRLGSDGVWVGALRSRGVDVNVLQSANCGFDVDWSPVFADRFAGTPLKNIAVSTGDAKMRGEAMITARGIEGHVIYALSANLRQKLFAHGAVPITIDLRPDVDEAALTKRLDHPRGKQSMSNFLRKRVKLSAVEFNLMREVHGRSTGISAPDLAWQIKNIPLTLKDIASISRAISSAGGIAQHTVTDDLELSAIPNMFVAGEMLDWDAPTGGYLLQATFATACWAANGILKKFGKADLLAPRWEWSTLSEKSR
ncbi:MAG: TIGR03862 family flavoprotein [Stappiaceae bacterium]